MQTRVRIAAAGLCSIFALAAPAASLELISEREAKMTKVPFDIERGAVGRGPSIKIYGPKKSESSASPFNLQIRFEAYGGAAVDEKSIRVIYFSWPRTDITSRLLPQLRDRLVDLRDVTAPAGAHQLEITVRDSRGYERTVLYEFTIE
jgi:hypothetical protein